MTTLDVMSLLGGSNSSSTFKPSWILFVAEAVCTVQDSLPLPTATWRGFEHYS